MTLVRPPRGLTDFQSEDMDTTAQPSEAESYSEQPMCHGARMHGTAVAILTPLGAKERTRWLSAVDCTLRYGPMQSLRQCGLTVGGTKGKI